MKLGIIGSGTWGTALANAFIVKHEVTLWSFDPKEAISLRETHSHKNLPGVYISEKIKFTDSLEETIKDKDIVIFAVPSIAVREIAKKAKPYLKHSQIIVDVAKGIEENSLLTLSQVITSEIGQGYRICALSGPTHAEEVAIGLPSLIVAASKDEEAAKIVQQELSLPYFRVYVNQDIIGVELSGALKNVIALAGGISDGLGYGDNAKAAIITRGLAEIARLGRALNCSEKAFFGLTGIGDIVVTATSKHSRNHNAGELLGKGYSLDGTLKEIGMVVEGINCLKAAKQLSSKVSVEMPIVDAVYDVVFNNVPPKEAVNKLFARDLKAE